uniref:Uncharacterized protein n=1 Tax=Anguilla anguilla TaxID=7936 RepID=A0A0E9WJM7_ANGAN
MHWSATNDSPRMNQPYREKNCLRCVCHVKLPRFPWAAVEFPEDCDFFFKKYKCDKQYNVNNTTLHLGKTMKTI